MKVYLDDERNCPPGWTLAKTAATALHLLQNEEVTEISLDHDLGDKEHDPEWTGYTVLLDIESRVVWEENYFPPEIKIHTANSGARPKMEAAVTSIRRYVRLKKEK